MTDLFGNGQLSMFGDSENLIPHPKAATFEPDTDKIRARLLGLLETARNAERMPWPEKKARVWQIVFPNMANWLPHEEAEQLRFAFATEIARLKQAA